MMKLFDEDPDTAYGSIRDRHLRSGCPYYGSASPSVCVCSPEGKAVAQFDGVTDGDVRGVTRMPYTVCR